MVVPKFRFILLLLPLLIFLFSNSPLRATTLFKNDAFIQGGAHGDVVDEEKKESDYALKISNENPIDSYFLLGEGLKGNQANQKKIDEAEDSPYLIGQVKEDGKVTKKDKKENPTPFLQGTNNLKKSSKELELSDQDKIHSELGYLQEWENYEGKKKGELMESDGSELLKKVGNKGRYYFNFNYFADNSSVHSKDNVYNRIIKHQNGMIQLSNFRMYPTKGGIPGIGIQMAIGNSYGYTFYKDGEKSTTKITIWSAPFDLALLYDFPLLNSLTIGTIGGPSLMNLVQNRSDGGTKDKKKDVWQASFGYFYGFQMKINLTKMFGIYNSKLLQLFSISAMHVMFAYRYDHYKNFKSKELEIKGDHLGVGFCYEYF